LADEALVQGPLTGEALDDVLLHHEGVHELGTLVGALVSTAGVAVGGEGGDGGQCHRHDQNQDSTTAHVLLLVWSASSTVCHIDRHGRQLESPRGNCRIFSPHSPLTDERRPCWQDLVDGGHRHVDDEPAVLRPPAARHEDVGHYHLARHRPVDVPGGGVAPLAEDPVLGIDRAAAHGAMAIAVHGEDAADGI